MEQKIINEGNELIAEFMGYEKIIIPVGAWGELLGPDVEIIRFGSKTDDKDWKDAILMKYHSSWDWLMPVLEKICRMKIGDGKTYVEYAYPRTFGMLNEEAGQIMVRLTGYPVFEADTLIKATYLAIIDFIKWYNGKDLKN